MEASEIDAIVAGRHRDAFSVLGPHENQIRAWLPHAQDAWVVTPTGSIEMLRVHPTGFFIAELESQPGLYRLRSGNYEFDDPYRFPPLLTPFELYLHAKERITKAIARWARTWLNCEGVAGVRFAVWAPNRGDGQRDRRFQSAGIAPGIPCGCARRESGNFSSPASARAPIINISVLARSGQEQQKCDPYGFLREMPPKTASIVWGLRNYTWGDAEWMEARATRDRLREPVSIYEVHLGSWMRGPDEPVAHLSRTGRQAGRIRQRAWATRISNCCP